MSYPTSVRLLFFTTGTTLCVVGAFVFFVIGVKNLDLLYNPRLSTPVTPLYFIKIARENAQSLFVFGPLDESWRSLQLAEKRLEEARILDEHGLKSLAQGQRALAVIKQQEAQKDIDTLQGKTDIDFLLVQYEKNKSELQRQEQ